MRTLRHLTQRKETETECNNLSTEIHDRLTKTDGEIKERWAIAAEITAPHLLVVDINELQGKFIRINLGKLNFYLMLFELKK